MTNDLQGHSQSARVHAAREMVALDLELCRAEDRAVDLENGARHSARPRQDRTIMIRELRSSTLMAGMLGGRLADTVTDMANRQNEHAQHSARHGL